MTTFGSRLSTCNRVLSKERLLTYGVISPGHSRGISPLPGAGRFFFSRFFFVGGLFFFFGVGGAGRLFFGPALFWVACAFFGGMGAFFVFGRFFLGGLFFFFGGEGYEGILCTMWRGPFFLQLPSRIKKIKNQICYFF